MTFADEWITYGPAVICQVSLVVLVVGVFGLGFRVRTLGTILAIATLVLPALVFIVLEPAWSSTPHGSGGLAVMIVLFESIIPTLAFLCGAIVISLLRHWRLKRFGPPTRLY